MQEENINPPEPTQINNQQTISQPTYQPTTNPEAPQQQYATDTQGLVSKKPIDKKIYYRRRLFIGGILLFLSIYGFLTRDSWMDSYNYLFPVIIFVFLFGMAYFLQSISGLIFIKSNKSSTKAIVLVGIILFAAFFVYLYWQYILNS